MTTQRETELKEIGKFVRMEIERQLQPLQKRIDNLVRRLAETNSKLVALEAKQHERGLHSVKRA